MDKNIRISILCQIYGKLLTEKQYQVLNDYYNNDLSLSEIAENLQIIRTFRIRREVECYEKDDGARRKNCNNFI